jgi:hypothetical protein
MIKKKHMRNPSNKHIYFTLCILFIVFISELNAQTNLSGSFLYDSITHKYMYKGSIRVDKTTRDSLYRFTLFCFDSLYYIGYNEVVDNTTHKRKRLGVLIDVKHHWMKNGFDYLIGKNRSDTILRLTATYLTTDNTIYYQYGQLRLLIQYDDERYKEISLEKAEKNGFNIEKWAWIEAPVNESIELMKSCILRNVKRGRLPPFKNKSSRYEIDFKKLQVPDGN